VSPSGIHKTQTGIAAGMLANKMLYKITKTVIKQLQKHNFTPCDIFLCSKTESQLLFRQAFTFILKTVNVER